MLRGGKCNEEKKPIPDQVDFKKLEALIPLPRMMDRTIGGFSVVLENLSISAFTKRIGDLRLKMQVFYIKKTAARMKIS